MKLTAPVASMDMTPQTYDVCSRSSKLNPCPPVFGPALVMSRSSLRGGFAQTVVNPRPVQSATGKDFRNKFVSFSWSRTDLCRVDRAEKYGAARQRRPTGRFRAFPLCARIRFGTLLAQR